MPALLALLGPLAGKLLAGLVVVIALLATYFGIKRKGTLEERERNQATRQKEVATAQANIAKAVAKDSQIDSKFNAKVAVKVDKIEVKPIKPDTGNDFTW